MILRTPTGEHLLMLGAEVYEHEEVFQKQYLFRQSGVFILLGHRQDEIVACLAVANTNSRREVTRSPGKQRQAASSRILLLAFDSVNDKGHPIIPFLLFLLVITKGYELRATTIEGQNAFAPSLCFAQVSPDN